MKHLVLFSSLLGAFCLAAPATGWSRDHHHHGGSYCAPYRSSYCGPSISIHSYRPYYGYSGYYPYAYPYYNPGVAYAYSSGPSYAYYRDSRSSDDDGDDLAVDVQRALARRGYYRGPIDGDVGPGTRGAIREYQYRNRLEVTGRIDRSLLRSLGVS